MDITTSLWLLNAIYNAGAPFPMHYHPAPQSIRRGSGDVMLSVRLPVPSGNDLLCRTARGGGEPIPYAPTLDDLSATDWIPHTLGMAEVRQPHMILDALERTRGDGAGCIRKAALRAALTGQAMVLLPKVPTSKLIYWDVLPTNTPGGCLLRVYGGGSSGLYTPHWEISYGAVLSDQWHTAEEAQRDGYRYATDSDPIPEAILGHAEYITVWRSLRWQSAQVLT